MNKEAILHCNTEEFVYPVTRSSLVFRMRAARRDITDCTLIYWDRTKPENRKSQKLKCCYRDKLFDYFQCTVSFSQIARYQKYYFVLTDADNSTGYYAANGLSKTEPEDGFFEYLYVNNTDVATVPGWAKGVIYYQIFPERFCNGDPENDPEGCRPWGTPPDRENFMGGDLEGIIKKIPYLKELGVECLYLNPIFYGDFNHKYATTDYFEIDPAFGTSETFGRLVTECHRAGIRVMLDGVFNHTGVHFGPFQDVLEKQAKSEYRDWFHINHFPVSLTHHDYECVGAYKWMPKLNSANREVREFIIKVMLYWIEKFGIDGWRLDVADEVDPSVWEEARIRIKEKYPDKLLLGETWGYAGKMLRGNQLDSAMNYVFRDAARDYFAKGCISVSEFDSRLNYMLAYYRQETDLVLYNLLDSHDTERFLFFCHENKGLLKLAVAFQMLFPGAPAVYYGDEAGITGGNDPDCRRCMEWGRDADQELFHWYQFFLRLRKEHSCIRRGSFRTIVVDTGTDTYGFVRSDVEESCYILLHKGADSCNIDCPVLEKGVFTEELSGEVFRCEEAGETIFLNQDITEYQGKITMSIPGCSVKVITSSKNSGKK